MLIEYFYTIEQTAVHRLPTVTIYLKGYIERHMYNSSLCDTNSRERTRVRRTPEKTQMQLYLPDK